MRSRSSSYLSQRRNSFHHQRGFGPLYTKAHQLSFSLCSSVGLMSVPKRETMQQDYTTCMYHHYSVANHRLLFPFILQLQHIHTVETRGQDCSLNHGMFFLPMSFSASYSRHFLIFSVSITVTVLNISTFLSASFYGMSLLELPPNAIVKCSPSDKLSR